MKVRKPERKKKETSKRRGGVPFLKAKSLVTLEAKNNFNRNLSFSSKKGKKNEISPISNDPYWGQFLLTFLF